MGICKKAKWFTDFSRNSFFNSTNAMMTTKRPIHPGVIVQEDILKEFGLTQEKLAQALGVSRRTINELVNEKRSITAEMALRLGRFTGTSPEMWLNLQNAMDLWDAYHAPGICIERVQTYREANPQITQITQIKPV